MWNRTTRTGRKVTLKTKQNGCSQNMGNCSFWKHWPWLRNYDRKQNGAIMDCLSVSTAEIMSSKTVRKIFKVKMMGKVWDYWTLKCSIYQSSSIYSFNRTQWLYDASDVIFPSVYMTEKTTSKNRPPMVRGRIRESMRLSRNVKRTAKPLVIAYHRYKFTDSLKYLSQVSVTLNS